MKDYDAKKRWERMKLVGITMVVGGAAASAVFLGSDNIMKLSWEEVAFAVKIGTKMYEVLRSSK